MSTEVFYKNPQLPYLECRRSTNSGRHYRVHAHSTLSIGAIDKGEVAYFVSGERGSLKPGELILINPGSPHYCNPSGAVDRNYYVLYLDKEWCAGVQAALLGVAAFAPARGCVLRSRDSYERFVSAMELLLGEGEALEKEQAILELVEGLFVAAWDPSPSPEPVDLDLERMKSVLGADLDGNLSLAEAAAGCGANTFTFLRCFKASSGLTPHAYRMNCRIERAKALLRAGADLADIALECGFYDQSHFTKVFKAMTAATPGEYRVNFLQ